MSRELKLALILGFAAVMVVGVLISDHMSGARQARIEERTIEPPRLAMQTGAQTAPTVVASGPIFLPDPSQAPSVEASPDPVGQLADAGETSSVEPVVLTMAPERVDPGVRALATTATDSVREFLDWTAKQGVVFEPVTPLAETSTRPRPSASPAPVVVSDRPAPSGRDVEHVVARNETLWGIAQRYYGDGAQHTRISEANKGRLGKGNSLYVGARLIIPGATRVAESSAGASGAPGRSTAQAPAAAPRTPDRAPPASSARASAERIHVVQKGETLGAIAARELGSARRWPEIVKLNKIDDPDNVPAGVRLRLPPR